MGGPIGALIGVAIASAFDSSNPMLGGGDTSRRQRSTERTAGVKATPADIKVSLMVLVACVMKADGTILKSELDRVKRFLITNFSEQESLEALQILKRLLEQDIDPEAVARQIATYVNYSTRLELLHFLIDLAYADGEFAPSEEQMIYRISVAMQINSSDHRSLLALYRTAEDPDWAYKALEVDPSASDDEVKKAYRRVAMKYHPDKVASAGEEIRAKATEKFQAINKAYEYIKKQRGIN